MRITLNFEPNSYAKKNGTFTIYLRATENGYHHKMGLDVYVADRKNFNSHATKENWISSKEIYSKLFNSRLSAVLNSAHKVMSELEQRGELSAQLLIRFLKRGDDGSFSSFIERKKQEYLNNKQYGCFDLIDNLQKKLVVYTNGKDIQFRDLTYRFVSEFVTFLSNVESRRGKKLSSSTIRDLYSQLKTLYKKAAQEDYITVQTNVFERIKIKRSQEKRIPLTTAEIDKIKAIELERGSGLWHTRNYFLFSMYMAGMRIGDVITLRWDNVQDDRLSYTMRKTKTFSSLLIHEKAQEILNLYKRENNEASDYIFSIMNKSRTIYRGRLSDRQKNQLIKSKIATINYNLKRIAKMAEINKNISAHIARHTFASIASQSKSSNIYTISQLLGHSSVSITQTYLNGLNYKEKDQCLLQVFK